jgi:hypothetical protein
MESSLRDQNFRPGIWAGPNGIANGSSAAEVQQYP